MQWEDEAIILKIKKFSERDLLVTVFARENGIFSGIVRSGQSKNKTAIFQPGNVVSATWKARLEEQLGSLSAELQQSVAAKVMDERLKLQGLFSVTTLLCSCMQDREIDEQLYGKTHQILQDMITNQNWLKDYVIFELELMHHLGFGLDLSRCAATGALEGLEYISPKTGRAVSAEGARGYEEKLFKIPKFLLPNEKYDSEDIIAGLELADYFLDRHFFMPMGKKMPDERARLVELIKRL